VVIKHASVVMPVIATLVGSTIQVLPHQIGKRLEVGTIGALAFFLADGVEFVEGVEVERSIRFRKIADFVPNDLFTD
jgi:hypothetical protein